jgi:hypothetical protein
LRPLLFFPFLGNWTVPPAGNSIGLIPYQPFGVLLVVLANAISTLVSTGFDNPPAEERDNIVAATPPNESHLFVV